MNTRDELMNIGDLVVDFGINPREKSEQTIDEFADIMTGYKEKGYSFDESWNQPIEATEDKVVTKGSHSLLAAKEAYGDQHQITVKIHVGVTGLQEAAFLSATSNIHGKAYKPGERKKAVFQVLEQTQNNKNGTDPDKKAFLSIRDIAEITGVSKGYVFELRADYRAEHGLPSDAGIILTPEELAEKRELQKTGKPKKKEQTTPAQEEPQPLPQLTEEEMNEMSTEDLREYLQKQHGESDTETTEPAVPVDPVEQPVEDSGVKEPETTQETQESNDDDEVPDISDEEAFEKYLEGQSKDPDMPTSGAIVGKSIGNTDVVSVDTQEILKEMNKERNNALKPVRNLMDDFLKLSNSEATESIDAYRSEIEFIRNDAGSWDPDVDPDINGRDIVSSVLLGLLDLMGEEHKNYSESISESDDDDDVDEDDDDE